MQGFQLIVEEILLSPCIINVHINDSYYVPYISLKIRRRI